MNENRINRRKFACLAPAFAASALMPGRLFAAEKECGFERVFAKVERAKKPPIPAGKRSSGGLDCFGVETGPDGVLLKFPNFSDRLKRLRNPRIKLALGNALENRDCFELIALSAKDGRVLSKLEVVNLFGFEPLRLDIPNSAAEEIGRFGIRLTRVLSERGDAQKLRRGEPVCLFSESVASTLDALAPHMLLYSEDFNPRSAFYENLCSLNSILPFGWMSGCQTEGLRELAQSGDARAARALRAHLDFFLDDEKGVVFNDPDARPCENGRFHSIEDFLPFVAICKLRPEHKSIGMFLDWALPRIERAAKVSADKRFLSTEGCYTYAYPLMQIASMRSDKNLAQTAIDEIRARISRLVDSEGGISQRANPGKNPRMRNWSRGAAWFVLGLVQTLRVLGDSQLKNANLDGVSQIRKSLSDSLKYLAQFQCPNGSWYCFADDPKTGSEATGTTGIAAAFALAAESGFADSSYAARAKKAFDWFMSPENVEPDGLAKNATQSNRIGDAFQRSGYRVIMQISSGFAAQIMAVKMRMRSMRA
ncbi:MAG: hypothetical protein DBX55_09225 [Verrucomicrobia bacterium]|nr:MAG: hypothetical protein DBX55_09225 [Verrucomicrobiota bacterium]